MKILKLEPNEAPVAVEIEGSLASMQSVVGGRIQAVFPFPEEVALICNEEGKLMGLPYNRVLRSEETDEAYDIICGTCFLCGAPRIVTTLQTSHQSRCRSTWNITDNPSDF